MRESTQQKDAERAYYNDLFARRGRFGQFQNAIYEELAEEIKRQSAGSRVVELGCGSGVQAMALVDQGFEVYPCDLSIEAARVARDTARSMGRSLAVVNADAEALPVKAVSMDGCVCGLLLHHFRDFGKVADEIKRVLKPGAVVVTIDANGHNPFAWTFFNVVHRFRPMGYLTPNQRAIRATEVRRVFGARGFTDFRFYSLTSDLRRDWLAKGLGMSLNHMARALVFRMSEWFLPQVARGNMLVSVFRLPRANDIRHRNGGRRRA